MCMKQTSKVYMLKQRADGTGGGKQEVSIRVSVYKVVFWPGRYERVWRALGGILFYSILFIHLFIYLIIKVLTYSTLDSDFSVKCFFCSKLTELLINFNGPNRHLHLWEFLAIRTARWHQQTSGSQKDDKYAIWTLYRKEPLEPHVWRGSPNTRWCVPIHHPLGTSVTLKVTASRAVETGGLLIDSFKRFSSCFRDNTDILCNLYSMISGMKGTSLMGVFCPLDSQC